MHYKLTAPELSKRVKAHAFQQYAREATLYNLGEEKSMQFWNAASVFGQTKTCLGVLYSLVVWVLELPHSCHWFQTIPLVSRCSNGPKNTAKHQRRQKRRQFIIQHVQFNSSHHTDRVYCNIFLTNTHTHKFTSRAHWYVHAEGVYPTLMRLIEHFFCVSSSPHQLDECNDPNKGDQYCSWATEKRNVEEVE